MSKPTPEALWNELKRQHGVTVGGALSVRLTFDELREAWLAVSPPPTGERRDE